MRSEIRPLQRLNDWPSRGVGEHGYGGQWVTGVELE